jgi:hypothetical protein
VIHQPVSRGSEPPPLFSTQLGAALLVGALAGAYTALVLLLRHDFLAAWPFAQDVLRVLNRYPWFLLTIPRKILMFCGPALAQRSWRLFFWAVFFGVLYHAVDRAIIYIENTLALPQDNMLNLLPRNLAASLFYVFLLSRLRGFKVGPHSSYIYAAGLTVLLTVLEFGTSRESGWIQDRADAIYVMSISNLLWTPLILIAATLGIEQTLRKKKPVSAPDIPQT